MAAWQTVRVFISSTFRDMQAERDYLVRFVFPRLREQLLQRRIHLVDVDLRWGVTGEQDASEVCREVITECRPRFLCMLGGRYGTIPEGRELSITADEVYFGVLDAERKNLYALFYFRHGTVTEKMDEASPGFAREPRYGEKAVKLARLKRGIRGGWRRPFLYRPRWDVNEQRLFDLKAFGDRVERDILATIEDELGTQPPPHLDEFAEENAAMEAFVEERSDRFVLGSRGKILEELLAHANATDSNGYLCLTGAPGSGKSALLAYLYEVLISRPQPPWVISHFIGASPGSMDVCYALRRLCHELKAGCPGILADIPDDPKKLPSAFQQLLREACAKKRVVILLDAVNQFEPSSYFIGLNWLPTHLQPNSRVILSTIDGPALDELRRRQDLNEVTLESLTAADGKTIITQFLRRYRKTMTESQQASLLAKPDAGIPLYLLAALEELRTLGVYDEISQRISELPPTTPELFAWILNRLENDDGFRDSAGRHVGRALVHRFGSLLGVSRHGLSQREIVELLAPDAPETAVYLESDLGGNVAALLHLLRPYLMYRGELLNFYHDQFRVASCARYMLTPAHIEVYHHVLSDYFASIKEPASRKIDELPWQLAHAQSWKELSEVLADIVFFAACWDRHPNDTFFYWSLIESNSDLRMVDAYLPIIEKPDRYDIGRLRKLASLLRLAEHWEESRRLYDHLERCYRQTGESLELAGVLGDKAQTLQPMGHTGEARACVDEMTQIFQQAGIPGLEAIAQEHRASLLDAEGDHEQALSLLRDAANRRKHYDDTLLENLSAAAEAYVDQQQPQAAKRALSAKTRLEESILTGRARNLSAQARILIECRRFEDAHMDLKEAASVLAQLSEPDPKAVVACAVLMGAVYEAEGNPAEAIKIYQGVENACHQSGNLTDQARVMGNRALACWKMKDISGARQVFSSQEHMLRRLRMAEELAQCLNNHARLLIAERLCPEDAYRLASEAKALATAHNYQHFLAVIQETCVEAERRRASALPPENPKEKL
jgi:tetratricopeptide (TPR) repeat protein